MSDDFENLKAAMAEATPAPDADAKSANLRLAQENFEKIQGSQSLARPMPERRPILVRLGKGVTEMVHIMTSRRGLATTTALVAVGILVVQFSGLPSTMSDEWMRNQVHEDLPPLDMDLALQPIMEEPVVVEGAPAPASAKMADRRERTNAMSDGLAQLSALPDVIGDQVLLPVESDTEAFANADQNPVHVTVETPVSTFSVDVDTASYAIIRNSLNNGVLPPKDAVRVEEMINYFPYDYAAPAPGTLPFQPTISVTDTPWNPDTRLVHLAIQGEMPALENRPPLNLVFLIDTSGSMQDANKLPLLKQSFRLMLGQLSPTDEISIVTYAGSAGQVLEPTPASDRTTILAALDRLEAGGATAGQQGLQQAYSVAEAMGQEDGSVSRIILATDGDFNVGISDPDALTDYISDKRDSGTYLSVLGFGRGNLDDQTMQALAQNGNGQAAYIDTLNEAQKVLVDQLTGALFPIADDVKIQVEFNPATVAEYRLIGYETRALNREDFNNDAVDAGEIGAGHSVTAIYEVTPVGSPAILNNPLRYQTTQENTADSSELGFLRMRYKLPGETISQLIEAPIPLETGAATADVEFSTAIAGFGQLLRGSTYVADWSWGDAIALANTAKGDDPYGYRAEAIQLMRLAETLSAN